MDNQAMEHQETQVALEQDLQITEAEEAIEIIDMVSLEQDAGQQSQSHVIEVTECLDEEDQSRVNGSLEEEHCDGDGNLMTVENCGGCTCNCHSSKSNSEAAHSEDGSENAAISRSTSQQNNSQSQGPSSRVHYDDDVERGLDNAAFQYAREISHISTTSTVSVKPPTYLSLGEFYLNDEPPKYESITGKKLADELQETAIPVPSVRPYNGGSSSPRLNCKSKVAGALILLGIILITGLLAYLSIANENNADNRDRQ